MDSVSNADPVRITLHFWDAPKMEYVAPGERVTLWAELESERPPLILDVPGIMGSFTMTRVPELAAFLNTQYCALGPIPRGKTYLSKDRSGCQAGK
jgi:hypothetical protein